MEGSLTADARRIVTILAIVGIVLIFLSGLILGTVLQYISVIGGVVALAAWALAIVTAFRARQMDWVVVLAIAMAIGVLLALITLGDVSPDADSVPQMGGLTIAFISSAYSILGGGPALERGVPSYCGGWGLLVLVAGGTLVGGAIGTNIGAAAPYITTVGFHLYTIAGVLALMAWIVGLVISYRTGAWGWFALVVLLPAVGAFMFGLFGPTRADVLMAQEQTRQRRAVGLR
jgi:hypothetical protein